MKRLQTVWQAPCGMCVPIPCTHSPWSLPPISRIELFHSPVGMVPFSLMDWATMPRSAGFLLLDVAPKSSVRSNTDEGDAAGLRVERWLVY